MAARRLRAGDGAPIPWRDPIVVLIRIPAEGEITYTQGLNDKMEALLAYEPGDRYIIGWPGKMRQDVFELTDIPNAIDWCGRAVAQ